MLNLTSFKSNNIGGYLWQTAAHCIYDAKRANKYLPNLVYIPGALPDATGHSINKPYGDSGPLKSFDIPKQFIEATDDFTKGNYDYALITLSKPIQLPGQTWQEKHLNYRNLWCLTYMGILCCIPGIDVGFLSRRFMYQGLNELSWGAVMSTLCRKGHP